MVRARVLGVLLLGFILIAAGLAYYMISTTTGTLAIQVRDTPASWDRVTLTFSQVRVHPAGAGNDRGWISLGLAPTRIDFTLPGNLTQLLASNRLPAGPYDQVEILVSAVLGVPTGGAPVAVLVPDGVVKATPSFRLVGGGTTTVTIDLDLARSILPAGNEWVFSPVLGPVTVG